MGIPWLNDTMEAKIQISCQATGGHMRLFSHSMRMWFCVAFLLVISVSCVDAAGGHDSPGPAYASVLQADADTAEINTCLDNATKLCELERDYCLMSVQEKVQYHLQRCLEEKWACNISCSTDFADCAATGTPQSTCSDQREICNMKCVDESHQCRLDAVNNTYEQLSAEACGGNYGKCIEYWYGYCAFEGNY